MKKKMVALSLVFALGLIGCGKTEEKAAPAQDAPEATEAPADAKEPANNGIMSGGWELVCPDKEVPLSEEVKRGFDLAIVGEKETLSPVALIGQQVVAGMNDMILAAEIEKGAITGYKVVVVYRDLQKNASLTGINPFNVEDYTNKTTDGSTEILSGGWGAPDEVTKLPLPDDVQTAFDKAIETFTGSKIEPMALLAKQVVAGTNYAILCRVTPTGENPVPSVQVVTVYADLEGGSEFTGFCAIDQTKFN